MLDDNFASIVTAAKWGRNVYASIQKFLQFQLTVNIAAVVTALVGSFAYAKSPLAAIQMLWVNLIMDSLASLALASEPPTDELLQRNPVNRSKSIVTVRMWANMLGQASYQLVIIMFLLFGGPRVFELEPGHIVEREGINSEHYTFIFNAFVWMQLFNEINSRSLNGEINVFKGMPRNPLFCGILVITAILQIIMVEFGGKALHVAGKFVHCLSLYDEFNAAAISPTSHHRRRLTWGALGVVIVVWVLLFANAGKYSSYYFFVCNPCQLDF